MTNLVLWIMDIKATAWTLSDVERRENVDVIIGEPPL